ncbi:MAG: ABC transporter ATP-binding protein [Deltaproteobacteria bacterium]|nr:ABC transporter ATP-binding protein [Deltaproteobacteria bacterium]
MEPVLVVDGIEKSFGGLKVTDKVSFSMFPGDLTAIIGPNGAGKTTLFNILTGHLAPDAGSIRFEGKEIAGARTQDIVTMGMGRAFQITSIFPEETVLDNVRVACLSKLREATVFIRPISAHKRATDRAYQILESLGLEKFSDRRAFELSHGDQKLLDIGIALALEPKLLLLDEPTSGMSPEERLLTRELIKKLWSLFNLTLLFIEHDMDMVFGIALKVLVLQQGALLVEGTPEEIRSNPEVITAYLGEEL